MRATPVPDEPLPALVAFLREAHPDPERFVSAAALDARVATETESLEPGDSLALARAAGRVLSVVGDAHFAVGLPAETASGPQLPLLIKRAGARVFVDASQPPLPVGTELLAIEGRPALDLLDDLAELSQVDGRRPAVRAAEAERHFASLALVELGPREHYEVQVRRPLGAPETLVLQALDHEGARRLATKRQSAPVWGAQRRSDQPPWPDLEQLDATTSILRLPSFGIPDQAEYEARIEALFAKLEPQARLVLDLRGNEGGVRTHGIAVLRHLLERPFAQWQRVATRVRAIPRGFEDRILFPIAPEFALTGFPGERRGDFWVVEGDPLADRMIPVETPHAGPVDVFVDDATNSAAVELLAGLLSQRDDVRVIGTETQGACGRHTGQVPVLFQHAGLSVFVSLFEIELVPIPGCEPGRGVVPDIEVVYTEEDFLAGRDPYLQAL